MRTRAVLILAGALASGCGGSSVGSAFAGSAALAPLPRDEAAHDALLRADLARSDSVAAHGYAAGLASVFDTSLVYLRGGLPIVRGRAAALAIVAADSLAPGTALRWQPVRAEASRDGRSGYTYGYAIYSAPQPSGTPSIRVDRYIAFWRNRASEWRISGYAETYGAPPANLALPSAAGAATLPDSLPPARGPLASMLDADRAFARDAGRLGTGLAFGRYAADDAQIFSGPGEFISGPEAITRSFGPAGTNGSLAWHPVFGETSDAGDLGYTVGNAVVTGRREDGARTVRYSKYLTIWRRQRDGSYRYVVDGGSARPRP